MSPRTERLLAAPIVPALLRLSAPGVLLVAFQSMVSVGDTYFVGRLGTGPLAGLALVFPLIMLLQMTSAGAMGGGVSSAIARALGSGDMPAALIPALNDKTMEHVLEAAAQAGAAEAAYVIMRLPNELKDLFKEWLAEHYPQRAEHVISIVHQMRGGKDNDPRFGTRMTGTGNYADLMEKRFDIACRKYGLNDHGAPRRRAELDCSRFRPPSPAGQMTLF